MIQDLIFLMAKEFSWSKEDTGKVYGHEIIAQTKRIMDWKKNNPMICPLLQKG
jgi:hypothetical protein